MAKNIRATAMGVILAVALGLGYAGFHAARRAEASRLAIVKKRAALTAEMRELEAMIAPDVREHLDSASVSGISPWRLTAEGSGRSTGPKSEPMIKSDPREAALSLALFRATLAQKYRRLYQTLGLSLSQRGAFENLVTAYQEEMTDLKAVASADGQDSRPEIDEIRKQEDDDFQAAQRALVGDAGFQQLQEFNRVLPVWNIVDGIDTNAFWPEPLAGAQSQQLAAMMANASSSYENGGPATPDSIDWNAVLPQAQGLLSATQFEGLKTNANHFEMVRLARQFFQHEQQSR